VKSYKEDIRMLFIAFVITGFWFLYNLVPDFPLWVAVVITVFGSLNIVIKLISVSSKD